MKFDIEFYESLSAYYSLATSVKIGQQSTNFSNRISSCIDILGEQLK
jgi:hypothetical protein